MGDDFAPEEILRALERHHVDYVLIGGFAAIMHGSPHITSDVDVVPARDRANLDRLSAALDELDACIRTSAEPQGSPFGHDGASLGRGDIWNLSTTYGDLDITFVPSGTAGYDDLRRDARDVLVLGVHVPLASLADVVRSKTAANRPKDQLTLPVLRRLLEEGE